MANRHKAMCKARGGAAMKGRDDYSGSGESNVAKEAKEKKFGGKVVGVDGVKGKSRIKKARGGGIGADTSPFSSAAKGGMANSPAKSTGAAAPGFVAAHGK
jgi:hypothetical protein